LTTHQAISWILKPAAFLAALMPAGWLVWAFFNDKLSANPLSDLTNETGVYGSLHFLTYAVFDRLLGLIDFPQGIVSWDTATRLTAAIGDDIYKRPYITVGFTAFVLMLPLALTSTSGMIRRLGGRRWQALHRLVYVSAILGVTHYWWLVKADIRRPLAYAAIVATLLGFRLVWSRMHRGAGARTRQTPRRGPAGAVPAAKP
jgi:sulfoxide reductase heme-binding subunit YedZ